LVQDFVRTLRLVNEDVITTSGLCAHLSTSGGGGGGHIRVNNAATGAISCYSPQGNKLTHITDSQIAPAYFLTTPENNAWYYWNGTKYEKCADQSNDAHPVKPN